MASAQVLPSSRKQEHLEAGKRRLEEFRKKKAAERAKKAASTTQPHASDVSLFEKHRLDTERVRVTDSDLAGSSDGPDGAVTESSLGTINNDNKAIEVAQKSQQVSSNDAHANPPFSVNDYNSSSADLVQTLADNQVKKYDASWPVGPVGVNSSQETQDTNNDLGYPGALGRLPYGHASDHLIGLRPQASQDYDSNFSQSSLYGMEESWSKENDSSLRVSTVKNPGSSHDSVTNVSPQNSGSTFLQSKPNSASTQSSGPKFFSFVGDSIQPTISLRGSALEVGQNIQGGLEVSDPLVSNLAERKLSSSANELPSVLNAPVPTSESSSFKFDVRSSFNHEPLYSDIKETNSRRSRPSFLDSLNVPRASPGTHFQRSEPEQEFISNSSQLNSMEVLGSSAFQKPTMETEIMESFSKLRTPDAPSAFDHSRNFSHSTSNGGDLLRWNVNENSMGRKHEFYSPKQDEDFAALEQHIEDLTQEKFSLQRALEASRALAESLAAENSSLTENYNQQRSVVNQLKSDMEMLQEEIKAQLVELESFKIEYANARLECNAADERANILASEVIGLEEKALRLRSNELKLERHLENSQAEVLSYKKKMSSIEKERQDWQSTIEALQEEKKVLQSKLRKSSASGKSIDVNKSSTSRKDMSTSTEDLANADTTPDTSNQEMQNTASLLGSDVSSFPLLPENGQLSLEGSSVNIPPDQMRMIQNINALISELALEKEELMQALSSESSQSSKLKDLNKELSQKLEAQTQRLELLTAQNMANKNITARQPDSHTNDAMHDNTAYADEGDEVVERVLGWIMKLFPGGPSKRRTSKLL